MQIKALADDKIRIDLNEDDLARFNITYDELDYTNTKTRRIIWTLLSEAENELGFSFDTKTKLLVEVCQKESDGCAVFFTLLKTDDVSPDIVLKKERETLVFEAFDENAFIDGVTSLKKKEIPSSEITLFKLNGKYFAVIDLPSKASGRTLHILSEFGSADITSDAYALKLIEHGNTLTNFAF